VAFWTPGKEQTFRIPVKFMMRVVGDYFSVHDINLRECRKIRHKLSAELIEGGIAKVKPYASMPPFVHHGGADLYSGAIAIQKLTSTSVGMVCTLKRAEMSVYVLLVKGLAYQVSCSIFTVLSYSSGVLSADTSTISKSAQHCA
jgi:hypothetical protein